MNGNEAAIQKKPGLIWAVRILYIIIGMILLGNIFSLISFLAYVRELDSLFLNTSYVAYVIFIIALASQFPYVFLRKMGKIKGNVMYLVALVMYTTNKLSDAVYDLINYQDFDIIWASLMVAVFITFYFLIKRLGEGREAVDVSGEGSLVKKAVRVIKENRM